MFQEISSPIIRSTKLYILTHEKSAAIFGKMGIEFHLTHDSSRQQYWVDNT
jgi:hypothetical protein